MKSEVPTLKKCQVWVASAGHRHVCEFRKGHPGAHSCWCWFSWDPTPKPNK